MDLLSEDPLHPSSLTKTWLAGAIGGLATFVVSAPTELVKCRAQQGGLRGLYWGGAVTSIRDGVGYGF
ncbi:hypothetical protein H2203_004036 [Taxawa tesnikishii (nom. ined.)]|nr:hypothetical protein H2203_004036 [Dothideales sp. JES 119]